MRPYWLDTIVILRGSVCIALLLLIGAMLYVNRSPLTPAALTQCFTSSYKTTSADCIPKTTAKLLATYSAAELLDYITATTSPIVLQDQCHPIGHTIGEITYEKTNSIEDALAACRANCRNACTHGAIGAGVLDAMGETYPDIDIAHADRAQLAALSSRYCAHDAAMCHAIGHVAYIATEDDEDAVGICDKASSDAFKKESCYQGVFMERAGTFINTLFPPRRTPTAEVDDYTYPCTSLAPRYQHACFIFLNAYQEPLLARDSIQKPHDKLAKARATCESLDRRERALCFEGVGTSAALFGYSNLNTKNMQSFCDSFATENDRSACVLGVLPQFQYQEGRGLFDYCADISETSRQELCYRAALRISNARSVDEAPPHCASYARCATQFESMKTKTTDYRFGLFGK